MKPTTLKQRFAKRFDGGLESYHGSEEHEVLKFFHKELMALAKEIKVMPWKPEFADEQKEALARRSPDYVMGLGDAAALIRNRANELV